MQVGRIVSGKYRLVRLVGDGGMGSVYEAQHEKLGTKVAIKFLHPELARRAGLADRFLQEARVAAQIKSPYVVQVTDMDATPEGEAYIVMELLEGEPLSGVLDRERALGVPVASEYARQILEALEAAHALGVVHRDLKPENVFVTFVAGRPILKLIDFGIAKLKRPDTPGQKNLTVAGVMMGTAEYMAPEQAYSADRVDARSDVYSVGVMLYEMIAGRRPVSGEDARAIAIKVERGEVTPLVHVAPDAPREIAGLVHRAMASRPELRFQSATEMRLALEGALGGKRVATAQLPAAQPPAAHPAAAAAIPHHPALAKEASTGTVMGAPSEAALAGPPAAQYGAPPQQTSLGGGTARVAPVQSALLPQNPAFASSPPKRGSSAGLLVLAAIIGVAAVGAIVASQTDLLSGLGGGAEPAPVAPPVVTPPPPPTPSAPPPAASPGAAADPLAPLVGPRPGTPGAPALPAAPHPHPSSSGPVPAPSGSQAPPSVPSLPTIPLPFPMPSGPMVIPTSFPSGFNIPIPGFGPPPTPPAPLPAAPSAAPTPSASAGY